MNMFRCLAVAAVVMPLAFATLGTAGARAETQGIVALANDQPITERDITERIALRELLGDTPSGGFTRKQALQNLIDDQAKLLETKRLGMVPTDSEIDARIDRVAKGMKLDRAGVIAKFKKTGIRETAFREYMKVSMAFTRLIQAKYREDVQATPAEVDAKMAEINNTVGAQMRKIMNDPRMQPVTVYSLMEITLPLDGEDPGLLQSRAIEAQQVLRKFKGCGSVKSAASGVFDVKIGKKFEADGSKLPKPMKQALDKAGTDRAIGPMRSKVGIQLIALCGVRKVTPQKPDFTMPTREQVERMVISDKFDKFEEDYLATVRDKVYVEYRNPSYAQQ